MALKLHVMSRPSVWLHVGVAAGVLERTLLEHWLIAAPWEQLQLGKKGSFQIPRLKKDNNSAEPLQCGAYVAASSSAVRAWEQVICMELCYCSALGTVPCQSPWENTSGAAACSSLPCTQCLLTRAGSGAAVGPAVLPCAFEWVPLSFLGIIQLNFQVWIFIYLFLMTEFLFPGHLYFYAQQFESFA